MKIQQSLFTPEVKSQIFDAFSRQSLKETDIDGLAKECVSFEIHMNNTLIGCVVVHPFWGQLHIKYLFVDEKHQGQGIGTQLMEHAFAFGREQGCHFAFVETMSFQAPTFYQKLGFKSDFIRPGYEKKTSFHYLSKDLNKSFSKEVHIRPFTESDISLLVHCFKEHHLSKPRSTFETYFLEQQKGERLIWIALDQTQLQRYITLKWTSAYHPFRGQNIPEIMDLNVLPPFRRKGVGSALLDTAEQASLEKGNTVGLGVGLYKGYGNAQKLYIERGYIPDGQGVTYAYEPVPPLKKIPLDDDLVLWLTKKLR